MEFAIPPSSHHIELLDFFLIISLLLFLPFVGMVLGGSLFSVIFSSLGFKTLNKKYLRFANDIICKLTVSKSAGLAIGVIPIFSITFIYAQFLYGADVISLSVLILSIIFYIAGFILIYNYRDTIEFLNIVQSHKFNNRNSGKLGVLLLFIASFLYTGGTAIAINPPDWESVDNIFKFIFNLDIIVNFLYFLSSSIAIASIAVLFFFFSWQGGVRDMDAGYKRFVVNFAATSGLIASLSQLFFLFIKFMVLPEVALSDVVFMYTTLAMTSILLVSIFLYTILRNKEIKFATTVFIFIFLTFTLTILNDQVILGNSLRYHLVSVTEQGNKLDSKKITLVETTRPTDAGGQQIFDTKCIACHSFDKKIVGPPYNETLGKYNGDVNKLAEYIFSPTKIDAGYPPMPNQGLTKKEAEAVASYILSEFEKGK